MPKRKKQSTFRGGITHRYQCLIRAKIRRMHHTRLFKAEKDVLLAIVNHAFHHMPKQGEVYAPGRERLAMRSDTSVRTVARVLDKLRAAGVIRNVAYARGGRDSKTQFSIDWNALFDMIGIVTDDAWRWMLGAVESKRSRCQNFFRAIFSVPLYKTHTVRQIFGGQSVGQTSPLGKVGPPLVVIDEAELPF